MGIAAKGFLLINSVRYLKPIQLVNQAGIRLKRKESFWEYERKGVRYRPFDLWIDGLDDDPVFMERFSPEELLADRLTLLNETRELNAWKYIDASHLWNFNVHYLEYLVPLYSLWNYTRDERYKDKLNQILDSWYEKGSREADSNQSYTISLRTVNQLIISNAVADKDQLYNSLYAQYRYLLNHQEKHLLGNHYLENLKAIVICSVAFSQDEVYEKYIGKFLEELEEETTSDGLHFEFSLMYHKIVLEDLIRVAMVLKQSGKKEYDRVVDYISKMCTALYSLEYGIDRTPLFNDAGDNVAKPTEALLNVCRELFGIKPERKDCVAGYHKIYDGKITLLVDCGDLAPKYMPGHGHCDCLSFELFCDGKPVFVNSGTYQYQGDERSYFRSTAAHNTVTINGHEQSELWGEHRAGRRISRVKSQRSAHSVSGSYKNYYGESHKRRVNLKDGVLEVLDQTDGDGQSYLHLAPGLRYENGKIYGTGINTEISIVNADIEIRKSFYAENFGKLEEIECLVFSWRSSNEKHGYRIEFVGGDSHK